MSTNISEAPKIAIVGSYDPKRVRELTLKNVDAAPGAGFALGQELARQGCNIVVYASYPFLLEVDVVRGYVDVKRNNPVKGCIQLHYSLNLDHPSFFEEGAQVSPEVEAMFDDKPDNNTEWEVSFYRSLREVDGMLMLGGGPSSMIAGVVAAGHRKPIVAIASFGGYAKKIWELLPVQTDLMTDEDHELMAKPWKLTLAREYVETLLRQWRQVEKEKADQRTLAERVEQGHREELARREADLRAEFERRTTEARQAEIEKSKSGNLFVMTSVVSLILALIPVAIALGVQDVPHFGLVVFTLVTPLAAGVCGSTIRVVFGVLGIGQDGEQQPDRKLPPLIKSAGAGFVGGGIMLLLYLTTQLTAAGDIEDKNYPRLILFVALVGLVAGFALDQVARRLSETANKGVAPFRPGAGGSSQGG